MKPMHKPPADKATLDALVKKAAAALRTPGRDDDLPDADDLPDDPQGHLVMGQRRRQGD